MRAGLCLLVWLLLPLQAGAQQSDPYLDWLKQQGPQPQHQPPTASVEGKAKAVDFGDFVPGYLPTTRYREVQEELRKGRIVEGMVEPLNYLFALPTNVEIAFAECQVANAFYAPQERRIRICYELIDNFSEFVGKQKYSDEQETRALASLIIFVLFHELGHALIDVLDLSFTGREEDAADQLSTYLMLALGDQYISPVHFAVASYQSGGALTEQTFADEHAFGPQRFYNIACWVYGSGQKGSQTDAELDKYLPASRKNKCPDEYRKLANGWESLLAPYIKQ